MAKDIKALELLQNELSKMKDLPDPPSDIDKIEEYENKWSQQLDGTLNIFDDIAAYTKAIYEQMETIRNFLNKSTEKVQKRILDIIDSIKWTDKQPARASSKPIKLIEKLQKLEQKKNRLEESIMRTQMMLNKIENLDIITREDVDALRGCIKQWINVRDESYEDEKRRKESEEKAKKEREEAERRRREEEERKRREEEERQKEKEEEQRKEAEEKARKEREEEKRRRQEEEERKRREEEERRRGEEKRRKEAEEKARKEREEAKRRRQEEEERKRREEEGRRREEEKRRKEAAEKARKEREEAKRRRQEEEERKRREEEEQRREEEKRRKEAEEKARKEREEAERRRRVEEERKRCEEEERRREEEERRKREEEERRRQEEEIRKREEEERKRLEEEEKRKREEEERRKREEEQRRKEDERKRKEEERRRREDERRRELERRRKEEEDRQRRLDPNNWDSLRYKRSDGEVDGARAGLCCVVSAIQGTVKEDDLECLASDEVRDDETTMTAGEIPASPVVSVTSKTGKKDLEAPMRVFVPYNAVDNDDEVVIKCSINGGDWEEKNAIFQPGLLKDLKNVSLVATEVNHFEEAKFIVVARTRSEDIIVDKPGLVHQSTVDKKVKFFFPRDTFKRPTRVKIQIRQIHPEHLGLATREYKICENILSTSPLVMLTSEEGTEMDIDIDITRVAASDSRLEKGRYHHVYKGKEKQWHFANSEIKHSNQDVTITLPRGKDHYSVIELETRKEVQKDVVLLAAEEIYKHAYKSVVRLIARQRIDDQSILMLQCLRRDQIVARLAELDKLGYSVGPDTSREFCISDGQKMLMKCRGNIRMTTRSNSNVVSLTYHAYMDSAKQEVSLSVVDENKQRDNDTYLGLLLFETAGNDKYKTKGELPITMPKIRQQRPRTTRTAVRFQPYLSALCKYLGWRLTDDDDDAWVDILRYLGNKREMAAIHRRAKIQFEEDEKRKICQTVFENWMKSLHLEDDKVQLVLDALLRSGYKELAAECRCFVKMHKVLFSEKVITALSDNTNDDLDSLTKALHLSSVEIKQCKAQQTNNQIYHAWSMWQQSDSVICRGPGASKYCLQTMESIIGKVLLLDDLKLKLEQSGIKD